MLEVGYISMPNTLHPVLLVWLLVVGRYVWKEQNEWNYTHHLFLPPGLTKFGWMTSTVMGPMSVCASVSTTHPAESLVTALKLSLSTAVGYHIITFYYVSHLIRFQGLGVAWRSLFLHKYYLCSKSWISHGKCHMRNTFHHIFYITNYKGWLMNGLT